MYVLEHSVAAYCRSLRDLAQGRGGASAIAGATVARGELARAQTTLAETKAKQLRGELIDANEVEQFWEGKLRSFRQRILSVPDRVPLLLRERKVLATELCAALTELADNG